MESTLVDKKRDVNGEPLLNKTPPAPKGGLRIMLIIIGTSMCMCKSNDFDCFPAF